MLIEQINKSDAERILLLVKNVDGGGSMTTGMGVAICGAAASADGFQAYKSTKTAGNLSSLFCGVALQDIAINAVGLVTAWGYAASVMISQSVGSWTITSGDVLIQGNASGTFASVVTNSALSTAMYKYVVALGAISDTISNPNPYMKGLVRAI